ncbi:hypothetical protein [Streptomyces sp. NPDC058812]|uniref:hypothetical protein n=1 Tax=unclassified Streptomyces TaxID=2593676 RepID=UPI0036C01176
MFAYATAENVTLRIDSTETVEELVVLRHPIPEPGTVSLEDFHPDDACEQVEQAAQGRGPAA